VDRRGVFHVEIGLACAQPFQLGHPKIGPGPVLQPAGEPDVIGMEMRSDDASDRPAPEPVRQKRFPGSDRDRIAEPGVDQHPGITVIQQVEVDVIERDRHRQPDPEDALGDLQRRARCRDGIALDVIDFAFHGRTIEPGFRIAKRDCAPPHI
jgi:hypothetical protein